MVKCKNCKKEIEQLFVPIICPECGHIMKPYTRKKKKTENNEEVIEEVEMKELNE